jgi:hypothetical protein
MPASYATIWPDVNINAINSSFDSKIHSHRVPLSTGYAVWPLPREYGEEATVYNPGTDSMPKILNDRE